MNDCGQEACPILEKVYEEKSPHNPNVEWFCTQIVGLAEGEYAQLKNYPCFIAHLFISQAVDEIARGMATRTLVEQYYHPKHSTQILEVSQCPITEVVKKIMGSFTPSNIEKIREFLQQQDTQL